MQIVLTNDDGIDAPGLATLERLCRPLGDLIVVAPAHCHSSMSHRVTTSEAIPVTELAPNRFVVHGTPADCTRVALTCIAPNAAWLFSGINRGGNLGADIYVSGTVAAAREAALLNVPAVAISHYVAHQRHLDWPSSETRAARAIDYVTRNPPLRGQFWNINLPHPDDDAADCELAVCAMDPNPLPVSFKLEPGGYRYTGQYHQRMRTPGHDVERCFAGDIALTLMRLHG